MNKRQQNYFIRDEISDLKTAVRRSRYASAEPPTHIAELIRQREALDRKINVWEGRERKKQEAAADAMSAELREIQRCQAFSDNGTTLKKIDAFRKKHTAHLKSATA